MGRQGHAWGGGGKGDRLMLVHLTESKYYNEEVKAHLIIKQMKEELFELSQANAKCDKACVCLCKRGGESRGIHVN